MHRVRVARLVAVDRPALREMLATDNDFPADAIDFYRHPRPPYEDFVAWQGDQVIGLLTGNLRSDFAGNDSFDEFDLPAGRHSFLSRIFVAHDARNRGTGTLLVRAFALEADRLGATFLAGSIDRSSDARDRRRFFERTGFTVTPSDQFGAPTGIVLRSTQTWS